MYKRRADVALLAQVPEALVFPATQAEVWRVMFEAHNAALAYVVTSDPSAYWRVGDVYYLDDPSFGPVVALHDLAYTPTLGLHRIQRWYTLERVEDPEETPPVWHTLFTWYEDPTTPGAEPQKARRFSDEATARRWCADVGCVLYEEP